MSTLITRVAFCENCFKEHNPHTNQLFLVYGSSCNDFYIRQAKSNGTTGFTPHILKLIKVIGENVVYEKACGICDIDFYEIQNGDYAFQVLNWTRGMLTLQEWNAWVKYKHDWDYYV